MKEYSMFFINRLYSRLITKAICISSFSLLALLAQLSLSGCISTHQERSLASVLADINRNALEKDYNLNTREKLNETWNIYPLSIAALENQPLTVTMLLNKGADIDASIQDLNKIASMQVPYLSYSRNRIMYDKANSAIERLNQLKSQQVKPVNNNSLSVRTQEEITIKPVADELLNIKTKPGKPAGKYDVAVVIGNANYSSTGTPNVDFAIQDAQVMRQYLIKAFGYDPSNIIYIENATLTKLNEVFGTSDDYRGKLYKWVKPGQSRVFIYYVGHGAPDQQSGEGYFVPVDANPQYISTSGYKLSTFYENLSRIPALKKTVVIDACFSGSSANGQLLKGVSGLTARLKAEPKASAADILLTSADMNQVSSWYPEKGHSLFTYFFLKGIQGDADTNKDGKITMGEMKAWLNDQVPYMARRITGNQQQPVMMGMDGDELVNLTR